MRELVRPRDRRILGVAAGMANYFGMDPTLMRALWIVACFMIPPAVIAYIVLGIVLPEEKAAPFQPPQYQPPQYQPPQYQAPQYWPPTGQPWTGTQPGAPAPFPGPTGGVSQQAGMSPTATVPAAEAKPAGEAPSEEGRAEGAEAPASEAATQETKTEETRTEGAPPQGQPQFGPAPQQPGFGGQPQFGPAPQQPGFGGQPYFGQTPPPGFTPPPGDRPYKQMAKSHNKWISGVAAGIAEYFDVDPILVRALFLAALFAGGFGFLVYIILAVVMPQPLYPPRPR